MKKLFTLAAAVLASFSLWAADPTYESYDWSSADAMAAGLAGDASVSISVVTSGSDGNVSGHWYKALNSAIDGSAQNLGTHLSISSATQIDSVEIFFCPNGTNNTNLAWAGWGKDVTPNEEVGENYGTTAIVKSSKSWDNATWQKIDLSDKEIYTIYISRQAKKLKNNTVIDNFGENQTVNLLGLRVWLASGTPAPTYTVTYKANNGTEEADLVAENAKKVAACTFTAPEGEKFAGWNTAADGNGDDYAVGDKVESDLTLYAQWETVCYKVIYDLVGGIGSAEVTAADATVSVEPLALIMSNSAGRITLTPLAGYEFKAGDIIEFSGAVGNSGRPFGIKVGSDTYEAAEVIPNDPEEATAGGTASYAGVLKADGATLVMGRDGGTTTTLLTCVIKREVECEATAIDNTEVKATAIKRIVNGQLLIEKNGVMYNAQGAVVR